jgi:hypothetical protein
MEVAAVDPAHVDIFDRWHDQPVEFCREVFGINLDEWQIDALNALPTRDRVAFIASKGVGKSFIEAVAGWWWMATRKRAQVICTSINAKNLKSGLWKEIGGLYGNCKLLQRKFQMNSERVIAKEDPTNWFMEARSWRDHADSVEQAQALAGLHGPAMLWLGDEAGSYHKAILASGSAMLANVVPGSGNEGKILLGGNPTDPAGPLGDISKNRTLWHVVNINGDPDNPKRSPRISVEWARQEIKDHGRDNPWVKVSVFGEFPDVGFTNLLGPNDVSAAILRNYVGPEYQGAQKRLGVDVARFGDDSTVIYCRQGLKAGPYVVMRGADTQQIADRVALAMLRTKAELAFVDQTGVGAGVVDALKRANVRCVGVDSSGKPTAYDRFFNKRAESWYGMAQWVKAGGQIPRDDTQLQDDLVVPTYTLKKGTILIEEKDQIKKRLGKSPDHADALALTFASPDMPAEDPLRLGENMFGRNPSDFNPLASATRAGDREAWDFDPNNIRGM